MKRVEFYLSAGSQNTETSPPSRLNQIVLEAEPLFTSDDVLRYNTNSHAFLLSDNAYQKVRRLEVPISGRVFVVTVGDRRVYSGAFWNEWSSFAPNGIIIMQPIPQRTEELRIEVRSYPRKELMGPDLRIDREILKIMAVRNLNVSPQNE